MHYRQIQETVGVNRSWLYLYADLERDFKALIHLFPQYAGVHIPRPDKHNEAEDSIHLHLYINM